jgi:hypothetical protein
MKKLTRLMTLGASGILAALAIGAGPAQAVTVDSVKQTKPSSPRVQLREGVQVTGFYQTLRACGLAGRFGERGDHWDKYDCRPVRLGPRTGGWALQVASFDNWERRGFDVPLRAVCFFPNDFRPTWAGQYGPGRPGRVIRSHSGRPIHGHPGRVAFSKPGPGMRYHMAPTGHLGGNGPRAHAGMGSRDHSAAGAPRGNHGAPDAPRATRPSR